MDNSPRAPSPELPRKSCARLRPARFWLCASSLVLFLGGCASPGEPVERKPPVPQTVADLSAAQNANDVVLTFTLPTQTVDHRPLKEAPAVEIYRGVGEPGGESQAHMSLLVTIPSASLDQYVSQGRVRYVDSLKPDDFGRRELSGVSYSVHTRASEKRDSDPSNVAYLLVRPAFDPIADLKAQLTNSAVVLAWTAPKETIAGSAPLVAGYRIYRAETESVAAASIQTPNLKSPLEKIGESSSPSFADPQFEFGKTYAYSVRSVVGSGVEALESADSNLAVVAARDIFPPAAPLGLVIAPVPAEAETPAHLELSWAVSPETDIAGYNLYRAGEAGASGTRLNPELLLTPAFRDMNVQPGHRYFYTVTAVDRSGNESSPSEAVSGGVPAESQPNP